MTTKYRQPVGRTGVVRAYARVLRTSETWGARRQLRTWQPRPTTTTSSGRTTGAATLRDTAAPPNQEDAAPHRTAPHRSPGAREFGVPRPQSHAVYVARPEDAAPDRYPRSPPARRAGPGTGSGEHFAVAITYFRLIRAPHEALAPP